MPAGFGITLNSESALEKEVDRITDIASGKTHGIESVYFKYGHYGTLKKLIKLTDLFYAKEWKYQPGPVGLLNYLAANLRDAQYCQRGRKFMRTAALNEKTRVTFARAEILGMIDEENPKEILE